MSLAVDRAAGDVSAVLVRRDAAHLRRRVTAHSVFKQCDCRLRVDRMQSRERLSGRYRFVFCCKPADDVPCLFVLIPSEPSTVFVSNAGCAACAVFEYATIQRLFAARGPNAVARRIVAVNVEPFQCLLGRRLRPHVCDEIAKVKPSLADANSPTPVVHIAGVARVIASAQHVGMRNVKRMLRHTVSVNQLPSRMIRSTRHATASQSQQCVS